ncbi:MAG: hypothetical protein IPG52_01010 [Rhodocyclaceae bacterium]|nr:hypothetical protein [Rhodocyclaceae bacterium]
MSPMPQKNDLLATRVVAEMGRGQDFVVNNAGSTCGQQTAVPVATLPVAEWRRVIDTQSQWCSFYMCQPSPAV